MISATEGKTGSFGLDLVYNPQGTSLPPDQREMEARYKQVLGDRYGIRFNELLTLANMPVGRFGSVLISRKEFHDYLHRLKVRAPAFQPRVGDVPYPHQHRLAGLRLRLRFQSDAGASAEDERVAADPPLRAL